MSYPKSQGHCPMGLSVLFGVSLSCRITVYVLAMVGHFKNVSTTFAQIPDRIPNVEFTTVSPTVANTMLAVRLSLLVIYTFNT